MTTTLPRPLARCATHPEPWLWLSTDDDDQAYAKAICDRCPLERSCLDRASDDLTGVRGGMAPEDEDRFWLREPAVRAVEHVPSRGAYVSGCRCDGCERENTRYVAEWRARGAAVTEQETVVTEQLAFDWSVA